eukprot:Colp12_sorted_trinity150504_noHs@2887
MELAETTLNGLTALGDTNTVDLQTFKAITTGAVDVLLKTQTEAEIEAKLWGAKSAGNKSSIKQAYAGIVSLLLEAAKLNSTPDEFKGALEERRVDGERLDFLVKLFVDSKQQLRILLASTSFNFPHITDASWRLDYYIKNNHIERVDQPIFTLSFKTETSGKSGEDVTFCCTMEQLQDLVNKLKDACKNVDKIAQA